MRDADDDDADGQAPLESVAIAIPADAPTDGRLVAALAMPYVAEMMGLAVAIARRGGRHCQTRLAAAKLVLDYAAGRDTDPQPEHPNVIPAHGSVRIMTPEQMRTEASKRLAVRRTGN